MKESDQRNFGRRPRDGATAPHCGVCDAEPAATLGRASLRGRSARCRRALAAWAWAALACSPQTAAPAAEALDREAFVETYAALRLAALQSPSGVVSDSDRDRVLAERGTSAEALLAFVERHGEDLVFMEEVWEEAQEAIREVQDGWTAR